MPNLIWTPDKLAQFIELYPNHDTAMLAILFNTTVSALTTKAYNLGIKKSQEHLRKLKEEHRERLIPTQYKPGNQPTHFFKTGFIPKNAFKKGNTPHNSVPVGTRTKQKDDGLWKEKVAEPNQWLFVHRMIWEQAHGPVPKGLVVVFRDRNQDNLTLENLELINRAELCRRNSIHRYPPELRATMRLLGRVNKKLGDIQHEELAN